MNRALFLGLNLAISPIAVSAIPNSRASVALDRSVLQAVADGICRNGKRGYSILYSKAAPVSKNYGNGGLDPVLIKALVARNAFSRALPAGIGCKRLRMRDAEVVDRALDAGWKGFYTRFRGSTGVEYLSLPSYSQSRSEAIVYVSGECGELCGSGFFWRLRKIGSRWTVEKIVSLWIS